MATAPDLKIGQVLGEFTIEKLLGKGGFGSVYLAKHNLIKDLTTQQPLRRAIKELIDPAQITRFKDEASVLFALSNIKGSNIVGVYDLKEFNGRYYLIMEYLEGGTLKDAAKRQLPEDVLVKILIEICRGLNLLHTFNPQIIHRDTKPENAKVQFTPTGVDVHVLDLGIAAIMTPGSVKREVVGTYAFAGPAQLRGDFPSIYMDQHSLGATAFYAMTDANLPDDDRLLPFPYGRWSSAREREAFLRGFQPGFQQIVQQLHPNLPASYDAHQVARQTLQKTGYSPALQAVVTRMLAHDDADKFETTADMLAALEQLVPNNGVNHTPPQFVRPQTPKPTGDPLSTVAPPPPRPTSTSGPGAFLPRKKTDA